LEYADGLQTPKSIATFNSLGVELFIPLLFWFNKDPRLAIPSVCIPFGQRFISIDLATTAELMGYVVNDTATATLTFTTPTISTLELYVNNIFVNPEIHDIYIKRIGFSLIRVHRRQIYNATKSSDEIQLTSLKWPIETLFVGMKVSSNIATTGATNVTMDKWHRFTSITDPYGTAGDRKGLYVVPGPILTAGAPTASVGAVLGYAPSALTTTTFRVPLVAPYVESATMDTLTLTAHGVPLYNGFPTQFYNSYLPFAYGGHNLRTPADSGALMVPFNLYPSHYQPSGHINVSRAREFFLSYTSSVISSSVAGTLYIVGIAINFLLISNGSAILRYST